MSSASRAALRAKRSKRASNSRLGFLIVGGVLVAAFAAAIALSGSSPSETTGTEVREFAPVSIVGEPLPDFSAERNDAAVGMRMPEISGVDFNGRQTGIEDDGHPKIIMFLAHWCPHCQAEVPVVQEWLDQGGAHGDLDVYSVVTATDGNKPNYPPSEWLSREGWVAPVIVDDEGSSAGVASGVTSYPFFVFVDADGIVRGRVAGELPIMQIEEAITGLLGVETGDHSPGGDA